MSDVYQQIKAYLEAAPYSLGPITCYSMPSDIVEVGCIEDTGGASPDRGFGVVGAQFENPTFRVSFRGLPNDELSPRAKAKTAHDALIAIQPGVLTGVSGSSIYLTVTPMQPPFKMKIDKNQSIIIGFNVIVQKEP